MADGGNWRSDEDFRPERDYGHNDRRDRDHRRDHHRRRNEERTRDDSRRDRRRSRSRSRSRERFRGRRDQKDERRWNEGNRSREEEGISGGHDAFMQGNRNNDFYGQRGQLRASDGDEMERREGGGRIRGQDWRTKLTSIRDAHFNRNKQAPMIAQNQFRNDGSFLEMFKKKLAEQSEKGEEPSMVTPNSLVIASSSIPFSPDLSLPPLTATPIDECLAPSSSGGADQDLDGVPMSTHKPLPVPVTVSKRRIAKPLKTGIVLKKPQEPAEDEASQEKLDAWSRYLQEVQKYKSAKCIDDDSSRPLVK